MDPIEKITWSALEYEEKEHNTDWFWALGVIVVAGATTAIIFKNYFFAILLVVGGFLLGFFALKKPEMVSYELNENGLKIKNRIYPYEDIRSFWVQKDGLPTLFVRTGRLIMPIISVPIDEEYMEEIKALMILKNIKEEKMKEHVSETIMESLGF